MPKQGIHTNKELIKKQQQQQKKHCWIQPLVKWGNYRNYNYKSPISTHMRTYVCLYCFQTTTSAIVDRFTKGLKGNEYFRVKVSLEKSTIIKKTVASMELLQHLSGD